MDQALREQAAQLLGLIWRGTPADYKSRYRRTIWQQFEDQVRSAAYTGNLGRMVNSLCLRLGATLGTNAEDREQAGAMLAVADERALLKLLREETTLIVLMVRIANQERQAQARERIEAELGPDAGPLFGED